MIEESKKVRLKTGEVARIADVLEKGVAYIAEIMRRSNGFSVTVAQISHDDIQSVFEEIELPVA
ncbi:MAG: hypothetical protein FWD35_04080 [Oscillospiraceae bacterium]|nr:hypothetical protein [Oscillospiraceae bacterium]